MHTETIDSFGFGNDFTSVIDDYFILARAAFAASKAGNASSKAFEASSSSAAILTD